MTDAVLCHCGNPIHYTNPEMQAITESLIAALGAYVKVTTGGRSWMVQRHYIALHGLKAAELPFLGFKEVSE